MTPQRTNTLALFPDQYPTALVDKVQKIIATRTSNTEARNQRIREAFNKKYNEDRKRYDDVISELCQEFSLAKRTVETALKGN